MELYQLEYFRVTCKYNSYTEAAKELAVTQPAISIAIKKLEKECNADLIDRKSKTFALTQMGKVLLRRAEAIHGEMANIHMDINALSGEHRESVRIAVPFTMCPELLIGLATGYIYKHADISLHLLQNGHEAIVEDLTNKTIDMGVFCKGLLNPTLEWKDYRQAELWACVPPEHRLAGMTAFTPQMLKDETLVLSKMSDCISNCIQDYFLPYNAEQLFTSCYAYPVTRHHIIPADADITQR
jgi:DNA-binding transcriptional LysR family regulator